MTADDEDLTRPERLPQQVARRLREAIDVGRYRPGDQLPTEFSLAQKYGVSRQTIRQALALLRTEGRVDAEQGRGTFVRSRPVVVPFSRYSRQSRRPGEGPFEAACRLAGVPGFTEMALVERRRADAVVAKGLGVPVGTETVCRRRYHHAGEPDRVIQIQEGHLPLDLVEGTPLVGIEKVADGIYAALDAIGHAPARITEEVSARGATPTEADVFRSAAGAPVVEIRRHTYDAGNRIVEWLVVTAAANQCVFVYDDLPLP